MLVTRKDTSPSSRRRSTTFGYISPRGGVSTAKPVDATRSSPGCSACQTAFSKDLRLIAVLPALAALFIAFAPPQLTDRLYSTFDLQDPTNRDRVAMARAGIRMVEDHPLTGVGPDVVKEVYPEYRDASAVQENNPHLHNVPLHIAAERGVPALLIWLVFLALVVRDLIGRLKTPGATSLAAAGLAAVAGMLAAGLFEYNFGDSEYLMLFLVLITLPHAAAQTQVAALPDGSRDGPGGRS